MPYENRMMDSSRPSKAPERSGLPTGNMCKKCGSMMFYAEVLRDRNGEHRDVEYCSGGCGAVIPAAQSQPGPDKPLDKEVAEIEDRSARKLPDSE